MHVGTLNPFDTMIRGRDTQQMQPARFPEPPETNMLIHDLRQLTQAIVGPVDTLEMAMEEHDVDLAMKSLKRLKENTNYVVDMLANSTTARWMNHEKSRQCDVAQVIEHVVASLRPALRQKRIRVHQRMATHIAISINSVDLHRLLLNLLVNAIEATPPQGGSITVTARPVSDCWVQITVSDNGCGITDKDRTRIFDEGYTTKAQRDNKGLGLAIVKRVSDTYHGSVRVWSYPGQGTEFTVLLPKCKKNTAAIKKTSGCPT